MARCMKISIMVFGLSPLSWNPLLVQTMRPQKTSKNKSHKEASNEDSRASETSTGRAGLAPMRMADGVPTDAQTNIKKTGVIIEENTTYYSSIVVEETNTGIMEMSYKSLSWPTGYYFLIEDDAHVNMVMDMEKQMRILQKSEPEEILAYFNQYAKVVPWKTIKQLKLLDVNNKNDIKTLLQMTTQITIKKLEKANDENKQNERKNDEKKENDEKEKGIFIKTMVATEYLNELGLWLKGSYTKGGEIQPIHINQIGVDNGKLLQIIYACFVDPVIDIDTYTIEEMYAGMIHSIDKTKTTQSRDAVLRTAINIIIGVLSDLNLFNFDGYIHDIEKYEGLDKKNAPKSEIMVLQTKGKFRKRNDIAKDYMKKFGKFGKLMVLA